MAQQEPLPSCDVYLGFGAMLEKDNLFRLRSHYLPLGKIGGMPSWLNPVQLPSNEEMLCKVCTKPMAFLLQVYATNPKDAEYSFHRTLFFFICRNPECCKLNDASNMRAFRCQLPRENAYYSAEGALDPDFDGDVPDPRASPDYPHLCNMCGCLATKKCARCENVWYCHRDHQTVDWAFAHKKVCGKNVVESEETNGMEEGKNNLEQSIETAHNLGVWRPKNEPLNPFVFAEYGIEMGREYSRMGVVDQESDGEGDDEDSDDDDTDVSEKEMHLYEQYASKHNMGDISANDLEQVEDTIKKDVAFNLFSKVNALSYHVLAMNHQVLRYERGGEMLLATDHAPRPDTVPICKLCGGERKFEMQLMPELLALLQMDSVGRSIDWATVIMFTCANNCQIENDGYAEEFLFKQDFN